MPANTTRRVIIDLEQYYCAYPEMVTSGGKGSSIRVNWAEALYESREGYGVKGNRNEIEGKEFWAVGDTFLPDGGSNRRVRYAVVAGGAVYRADGSDRRVSRL